MGDVPGEVVTTDSGTLSLPPSRGKAEGEMAAHRIKQYVQRDQYTEGTA
jgi:hypothetical protein